MYETLDDLIERRRRMIAEAGYCLTYWQQRLAEKPRDAYAMAEVDRWKSRIESLELSIIGMRNAAKSLETA